LRKALEVEPGLYAESNLSANRIRDMIRQLLAALEIPAEEMKFFLREDRDAGRSNQSSSVKATCDGTPKRLYESLSAFGNRTGGGVVLFGLDESGGFEIAQDPGTR
jgi:hypothetical protein